MAATGLQLAREKTASLIVRNLRKFTMPSHTWVGLHEIIHRVHCTGLPCLIDPNSETSPDDVVGSLAPMSFELLPLRAMREDWTGESDGLERNSDSANFLR